MERRSRTLLRQMGLVLMIIQVLIAILIGVVLVKEARNFYEEERLEELGQLTPWAAAFIESTGVDSPALKSFVDRICAQTPGLRITVIGHDGTVVFDSLEDVGDMDNHQFRPEIIAAIKEGHGHIRRHSSTLKQDMLYYAAAVTDENKEPLFVVRTAVSMQSINTRITGLTTFISGVLIVSLLMTLIGVYIFSTWLSNRVSVLVRGGQRFASGALDHRIERPGTRELDLLAGALNHMASELETRMEMLQVQQGEVQAILQSMSNGVIALDLDGHVLSMNRAALTMLDLMGREVRGHVLQEFVRDPALDQFVRSSLAQAEHQYAELKLRSLGGRVMEATGEPLFDSDEKVSGALILLDEITHVRQLERIRTDFAANVSHELRTPIMSIQGYAELVREENDPEQRQRYLDIVLRNIRRLSAIIEDLLSLARLEEPGGGRGLERESLLVSDLLQGVRRDCSEQAEICSIDISVEVVSDLRVEGNRELLHQAVANLLVNAIRYSEPGDEVVLIGRASPNEQVIIAVSDTGPGIAAEHLPRLFERFYRVDKGRSRQIGGTGLGLAIVKHIARVHGGITDVISDVGVGSRFSIYLPAQSVSQELPEVVGE